MGMVTVIRYIGTSHQRNISAADIQSSMGIEGHGDIEAPAGQDVQVSPEVADWLKEHEGSDWEVRGSVDTDVEGPPPAEQAAEPRATTTEDGDPAPLDDGKPAPDPSKTSKVKAKGAVDPTKPPS